MTATIDPLFTRCGCAFRRLLVVAALAPASMSAVATVASAQQLDSVRAGIRAPVVAQTPARAPEDGPPISPRRAFLYSFLVPGSGQARLDRSFAGGMFFLIEATTLVLVHRSAEDLRIARRFAGDSMPLTYQVDPVTGIVARDTDGAPIVATWSQPRYDAAWVRTRRLHYEDWLAVLFFNHLFAGADAFVAAHLWDLPGKLAIRQTPFGPLINASFSFR